MQNRTEQEISEKTFLTLQGTITLITTVSLALSGWMLLGIHDIQVHEARVDQQLLAFKESMETQIIVNKETTERQLLAAKEALENKISTVKEMQERIIVFNKEQRALLEDLQVRVRVIESSVTRRHVEKTRFEIPEKSLPKLPTFPSFIAILSTKTRAQRRKLFL